jgi:uncharacterized damage-inducible protein DinB
MAETREQQFLTGVAWVVEHYRDSVREDLEAIPEARLWERPVPGMTSPANLALHLTGNLRHFFGHLLYGSDYARDRDREFAPEPWAEKADLLAMWDEACVETRTEVLASDPQALGRPAPVGAPLGGTEVQTYMLRLVTHLTYHAGQIHLLRRLLAP